MSFNHQLHCIAEEMLDRRASIIPDDVVQEAMKRCPEMFDEEMKRLALQQAKKVVADHLTRRAKVDETQGQFPGMHLPAVLTVPTEGGVVYVRTDKATITQARAHKTILQGNIDAAITEYRKYTDSLDQLESVPGDPDVLTIGKAIEWLDR